MPDMPAASELTATTAVLVNGTAYKLSLHTADPGTTGANEVAVAGYARQTVHFTNGVSTDAQVFSPTATITQTALFIAVWSAGGTFLWGGPTQAVTGPVPANATITFAIAAVTAGIA